MLEPRTRSIYRTSIIHTPVKRYLHLHKYILHYYVFPFLSKVSMWWEVPCFEVSFMRIISYVCPSDRRYLSPYRWTIKNRICVAYDHHRKWHGRNKAFLSFPHPDPFNPSCYFFLYPFQPWRAASFPPPSLQPPVPRSSFRKGQGQSTHLKTPTHLRRGYRLFPFGAKSRSNS